MIKEKMGKGAGRTCEVHALEKLGSIPRPIIKEKEEEPMAETEKGPVLIPAILTGIIAISLILISSFFLLRGLDLVFVDTLREQRASTMCAEVGGIRVLDYGYLLFIEKPYSVLCAFQENNSVKLYETAAREREKACYSSADLILERS